MKSISTRTAATVAALALVATPAFAQDGGKGQTTSPAKICKAESKKKTLRGKGKSPFAACVVGAKRQQAEAAKTADPAEQRAPGQICADQSRKKAKTDPKSPFAACVKGVTETRKAQREAEQEQQS
ncbi:MAG TPA: hypothetical protein VGW10_06370 [Solirubrobacteraceae bacterium]|nr:hypothetical protein [Solirubrobacteraceae bacterium]